MRRFRWSLLAVLLFGAALRLHALAQEARFHPDEALFAAFARHAAVQGDWLLRGDLDKPPLAIFAAAVSMGTFAARTVELPNGLLQYDVPLRAGEFTARLPFTLAGILLIALIHRLARALYADRRTALLAAIFTALSPYAIAFSGTAFADMLMLLCMAAALDGAARGRPLICGLALGIGLAVKPQALYIAPLAAAVLAASKYRPVGKGLLRAALPIAAAAFLLTAWDAARTPSPSFWALGAVNNNPQRLIRSDEIAPRAALWFDLLRPLFGSPTLILLPAGITAALVGAFDRPASRTSYLDLALLVWSLAYLAAHTLIAFNTYDRYVLPLLIPLALIAARGAAAGWMWLNRRLPAVELRAAAAVVLLTMMIGAWNTSGGERPFPDAASFTRQDEIVDFAGWINAHPPLTIVYDRWLGWELTYYLGEWTSIRRVYYPTPDTLAAGALAQPDPAPRLFVAPSAEPLSLWLDALRGAGFTITREYQRRDLVAYLLILEMQRSM